ncbi:hypothetical protein HK096_009147, partial [Nowakowskiella sp. JEL0078]
MGIAYFLDPKSKAGVDMHGDDCIDTLSQLKDFIKTKYELSHNENIIKNEIENFICQIGNPTAKLREFISNNSTKAYWILLGRKSFPILGKIADIIFSIPTSQAA